MPFDRTAGGTASASVQSSKAVELELLNCSRRRLMSVDPALRQIKQRSKYFADRRSVVTDNRQTAAPFRTVKRECPNNHVATRSARPAKLVRHRPYARSDQSKNGT